MVDEFKRARDAVGEDALVDPSHTGGDGEAEKDGGLSTALSNDGEGVAKVFKEVVARCQSDLPLAESAGRCFFETDKPARYLTTEARLASVTETAEEVDSDRKIARKFGPGVGYAIDSLVFGQVDAVAAFGSRDVRRRGELVGPLGVGRNEEFGSWMERCTDRADRCESCWFASGGDGLRAVTKKGFVVE